MQFVSSVYDEYLPLGKLNMVLGGVGSVRLAARERPQGKIHFLGASDDGVSHEGIPILVDSDLYDVVAPRLKEDGACSCDITGKIEVLPADIREVNYDVGVPRYAVKAEEIGLEDKIPREARVSLNIVYSGAAREYETKSRSDNALGWSFVTFSPLLKSYRGKRELNDAVQWLQDYARRHSVQPDPLILCDFDEHMDHFELPVAFKIADLFRGELDPRLLELFQKKYGVMLNITNQYGDVFHNISGSTILNRNNPGKE
jgi:hypothetical protein